MSELEVFGTDSADESSASADGIAAEEQWRSARQSVPSLRVEVPNETLATTLTRQLQPLEAERVAVDGYYEVGVELREHNPEQKVTKALSSIDAWLARSGLPSVRIHIDGCTHTLHVHASRASAGPSSPRPPRPA